MDRWDFLNLLVETFDYKSYLEIGVSNPDINFDRIKVEKKYGVDPEPTQPVTHQMKSDDFFAQNNETFDLIFVDGYHVDDQVTRDIANSLKCLNPNGAIVVHDCNPLKREHQAVPAEVTYWVGTVWKAWARFMQTLPPAIEMFVVNNDTGMGVMKATGKGMRLDPIPESELTFENLDLNRDKWLNLVSLDFFKNWVKPEPIKPKIAAPKVQEVEVKKVEVKTDAKAKTDKLDSESKI
jgi:hypothetical protein